MTVRKIIIIVFSFQVMLNITRPLVTLFANDLGASTLDVGMLTASYSFFPLILAIYAGRFADRFGDKVPIVGGVIGGMTGLVVPYCFPSMWALYASQVIIGISHIFTHVSLQNLLGHVSTKETRDHNYSIFSLFIALSNFIGPIAGGYLAEHYSYAIAYIVSAVIGIVPILFTFTMPAIARKKEAEEASAAREEEKSSTFGLLKIPVIRNAIATSALVLYSRDIFVAYFPLYALEIGMSNSRIGWVVALQGLAMIPVRLFLAKATKKWGREPVLLASILLAGATFALVPVTGDFYVLLTLSTLMGVGLGVGQPLSLSTTFNASPKNKTGEIMGLRLAVNRLSQLIAPLFFGIVGNWLGVASVFYVSGAFLLGGSYMAKPSKNGSDSGRE